MLYHQIIIMQDVTLYMHLSGNVPQGPAAEKDDQQVKGEGSNPNEPTSRRQLALGARRQVPHLPVPQHSQKPQRGARCGE